MHSKLTSRLLSRDALAATYPGPWRGASGGRRWLGGSEETRGAADGRHGRRRGRRARTMAARVSFFMSERGRSRGGDGEHVVRGAGDRRDRGAHGGAHPERGRAGRAGGVLPPALPD